MLAFLLSPQLADFGGHMMGWGGGWGAVMMIGMVLFWSLVIVGILWLLREIIGSTRAAHGKPDHDPRPDTDPLRTLDRRLAEGAISPDDYRERRAILEDQLVQPGD